MKLIKLADRDAAFFEATRLAGFADAEARQFFGRPPKITISIERAIISSLGPPRRRSHALEKFKKLFSD